jgi:hypothetical protein
MSADAVKKILSDQASNVLDIICQQAGFVYWPRRGAYAFALLAL